MNKSYMDRSSYGSYQCARLALRVAAVLFTVFIIVCVAVGVTLIFTQKPVDLLSRREGGEISSESKSSQEVFASPTRTTPLTLGSRKKFPSNYVKFSRSDLFANTFITKPNYYNVWTPDGNGVLHRQIDATTESESLSIITATSTEERPFIDAKEFPPGFNGERIKFSATGKYVALYRLVHQGFRHSKENFYLIARVSGGKLINMAPVGPTGNGSEIIQEFAWNTDPISNSFVYVASNTLFYQSDPEIADSVKQLTQNGSEYVKYGISDWLYEEDVLMKSNAHWWSPSGKFLSYIKFDDTDVNKVWIKKYTQGQYPEYQSIPYPKAGVVEQPKIKLYLWNRDTSQRVVISPPEQLNNHWMRGLDGKEEKLITVWANRKQTNLYFTLCNARDCVMVFEQSYTIGNRKLWAFPSDFENIYSSTNGFFTILPVQYTDGNIYNHVAHVKIEKDGIGRVSATHGGPYDVENLVGYNVETDTIAYQAMGGGIASNRFYRINKASSKEGAIHCLSCALPNCESATANVSPTGLRSFVMCKEPFKDPRLYLMDLANPHNAVRLRGTDETSLSFDPPTVTYETIRLPSGIDAHVGLMMPPRLDPNQKYPVLLDVYAGPNSYRNVLDTPWDFLIYLCSSEQMIIATVDARGSSRRGWNVKEGIYENLGVAEVEDQLSALKELSKRYEFIDKEAISVIGWSYGGFVSTHMGVLDQGEFLRCIVAVAPVSDFHLYDSAYTERYLGLPSENQSGYNASVLINKVNRLANVSYLLAHGEADDNVHYQHSALLSQALQLANIHFTQLVYANQDHGLFGMRRHLYEEVINFFTQKCLRRA